MEFKKILIAMAAASLAACGGDDKDNDGTPPPVELSAEEQCVADGNNLCTLSTATVGAACGTVGEESGLQIRMEDETYKPLCDLSGTIDVDATLTADYVYRLNGYVNVGKGFGEAGTVLEGLQEDDATATEDDAVAAIRKAGVTLTVEAGVHFRSADKGSLIISRGSEIQAAGTAAAPIVMSSIDGGFEGQGEWGGLVLQGFAKNNKCGGDSLAAVCDTADEAGTGFHGGNDDSDSSGSIQHLIVAEGGYEIAPDSEVNGITLHSVGYGTTIENVMVYNNADDGIEWFGGAVNVKNLILVDNGDESLDWDDGWRGNVQFVLVRQGLVNKGDHGIEADNKGLSNTAIPVSNPTVANVTFQTGAEGSDDLFRFKLGTQGTLINIAADNYAECVRVEHPETSVELVNLVAECAAYDDSSYVTAKEGADASQITGAPTMATTVELGSAFELTGSQGTVATAPTFPSANGSTGFFTATTYIGAVDPQTVTSVEAAWFAWAAEVVPAAFQ